MSTLVVVAVLLTVCQLSASQTSPEQIHLALTGVPGQMVVSWATQQTTNGTATVQYGPSASQLSLTTTGESFPFVDGGVENRTIYIYNVKLVDLTPATQYFYRVGDGGKTWSTVYNFTTLPAGQPEVEIAVFGDMGVENAQSMPLLLKEAAAGMYDMILHVGDMAYNMDDDNGRLGDEFMNMIQPLAAHMPYQVCLGNHESAYNFSHYTNRFSGITAAGVASGSNTNWWFSFDISYVHFVAISSELWYHPELADQLAAQYAWLDQDLAKANANRANVPWIIVYGHRPMYCSNVDDMPDCSTDAQQMRRGINGSFSLEDMIAKYNTDVYFTAHEHSYERTYPVYRGTPDWQQQNHTYVDAVWPTHIVTGAGGCPEDLDYYDEVFYGPWSVVRSASYGYGHLTIVNATHLHWRQYLAEDTEGVDELWLVKTKAAPVEPVDVGPPASECDAYCYAVCSSSRKQSCVELCHCEQERDQGVLHKIGTDVQAVTSRVLKH